VNTQVLNGRPIARVIPFSDCQQDRASSAMKIAIATGICVFSVAVLMLGALIAYQPKCGGFVYEFEFRSPVRQC
jgi:hypothetical protein